MLSRHWRAVGELGVLPGDDAVLEPWWKIEEPTRIWNQIFVARRLCCSCGYSVIGYQERRSKPANGEKSPPAYAETIIVNAVQVFLRIWPCIGGISARLEAQAERARDLFDPAWGLAPTSRGPERGPLSHFLRSRADPR